MEEIINPGPETAAQPPLTRADLEAELAALTEAFQTRPTPSSRKQSSSGRRWKRRKRPCASGS